MFNSSLASTSVQSFKEFLWLIVQAQRLSQPPNLMQRFSPLFIAPNLIAPYYSVIKRLGKSFSGLNDSSGYTLYDAEKATYIFGPMNIMAASSFGIPKCAPIW